MQKDNSTFLQKTRLRRELLGMMGAEPIICESHGGAGRIWQACYSHVEQGVVFEKNAAKVDALAKQRPGWSVHEGDCEKAIRAGFGRHLEVNFLDCDPYGSPFEVIDGFLMSERPKPKDLFIAVNDGLRQKVQLTGGWDVEELRPVVERFGASALYRKYLAAAELLMNIKAAQAGYTVSRFWGYHCGANAAMTHYAAILSRA